MIKSIRIAVLSFVHFRGWCAPLHKESVDRPWREPCPLVHRIMLDLYPPLIFKGSEAAFEEMRRGKGIEPGSVIKNIV